MSRISEWCSRMSKIKNKIGYAAQIEKMCPYGNEHFCDGRPIKARGKDGMKTKYREQCEHFKDGRCELKLHTEVGQKRKK